MGKISAELADFTIITSDNPRLEPPMDIITQIESGVKEITSDYLCIENRKDAIKQALKMLKPNDVAVISGKGAENYLDMNGIKYPYSDQEAILSANKEITSERLGAYK